MKPFLGPDAVLLRLRANGTRDKTFGVNGVLRVSIGRGDDAVAGVARLPDNRLVAGGAANNLNGDDYSDDVALYAFRAQPSGRVDPTFGRRGVATVRVPTWIFINPLSGIAASPDGSVVVGGVTSDVDTKWRLTLVRFDARGRLDRRFGNKGVALHRVQGPRALARQPDGRLLVVGMTDVPFRDWFVLRLRPDGTRDPTFGGRDGLVVTSFGRSPDSANAVAVDSRGRIVVAGAAGTEDTSCTTLCRQLRLVRYLPNGRLDPSFGTAGRAEPEIGLASDALSVAFQQGRILVAGSGFASGEADPHLAIWRFAGNGRLDGTFGERGVLTANPTGGRIKGDYLTHLAVQPDGRIVAAGGASKQSTGFDGQGLYDIAVLRAR